jgi:hypothetical protein
MGENTLDILVKLGVIGKDDVKAANELLAESGKTIQGAGESAEMSHLSMRRLANVMGQGIPGAAGLMESAFTAGSDKMMSATFLLIGGIEMLQSAIKKLDAELAEANRIGQELNSTEAERAEGLEKTREALEKAEVAENIFHHNLLRNTRDSIAETAKLATELLKASTQGMAGQASEHKEIANAEIEEMEKRGVISHETATAMKLQIDLAYHKQKVLMMMAEEAVQMQVDGAELKAKQDQARALGQQETAAASAHAAALQAQEENKNKIEGGQAQIARGTKAKEDLEKTGVTDESVQKIQAAFAALTSTAAGKKAFKMLEGSDVDDKTQVSAMSDFMTKMSLPEFVQSGIFSYLPKMLQDAIGDHTGTVGAGFAALKQMGGGAAAFENLSNFQNAGIDIASGKAAVAQGKKAQPGLETAEGDTKDELDAARDELKKNRALIADLQTKINTEAAVNAVKDSSAIGELGLDKASAAWTGARGIADNIAGGGKSTVADQQKIMAIASQIAGHAVNLATAVGMLEAGANNFGAFQNQVGRLAAAMGHWTPADHADLQNQIDNIIARMNNQGP